MKVDNFALATFMACPIKYKLRIKEGWTSRRKSSALGFGGAIHEGLATWYRTGSLQKAILSIDEAWPANVPVDDYRDKAKCIKVMAEYVREYPEETFHIIGYPSNPLVECTFTHQTGMYMSCWKCGRSAGESLSHAWINPETKALEVDTNVQCPNCGEPLEPLEYGGIFDGLVEFSGEVYVFEHKSTSQLGDFYFNQFKPNNQISGYVWGGQQMSGRRVGGAIVNAIGVYKVGATKFKRQITTRTPESIAKWLNDVHAVCEMIRECERTDYWPMFTPSCTDYGQCEYYQVHILGSAREQEKMLEQDYVKEEWVYEQRAGLKAD